MTAGLIADITMVLIAVCGVGLAWAGIAMAARLIVRLLAGIAGAAIATGATMEVLGEWDLYALISSSMG